MSRKHRIVHLISFVALVVSLFSPVLSLPVIAVDPPPDPEITLLNGEEDGSNDQILDQESDTPSDEEPAPIYKEETEEDISDNPERIRVTPLPPILTDAVCTDGTVYAQYATAPVSEGIDYVIGTPDASGAFTVTATLTDATIYAWSETGLDGWSIYGNSATQSGNLKLCPVPEPVVEEPGDADIPDPEGETGDDQDLEQSGEPGEPTIGRGPARATTMARGMDMQATSAGMFITKTANPASGVEENDLITYTIRVTNNTGEDRHYTLVDDLPTGVRFNSATVPYPLQGDYCDFDGANNQLHCGLVEGMVLYPGWTDEWTITVTVDPYPTSACLNLLVNSVTGSWEGENFASASSSVRCSDPVLSVAVSDGLEPGESVKPGEDLEYTITVTNSGELPITQSGYAWRFRDFPAHTHTFVFLEKPAETVCQTYGVIACWLPPGEELAAQTSHTFVVRVVVSATTTESMCDAGIAAQIEGNNGPWSAAGRTTEVITDVNCGRLAIQITAPDSVQPGGVIKYTVQTDNTGTEIAKPYTWALTFPLGVELAAPDAPRPGCTYDGTARTLTCTSSGPQEGWGGEREVDAFVSSGFPADECTPVNATVTGTNGSWVENRRTASATTIITDIVCTPVLTLDMTADKTHAIAGDEVTYTIQVTNEGSVEQNHMFRFWVDYDQAIFSAPDIRFSAPAGVSCFDNGPGWFDCSASLLGAGDSFTVTVTLPVRSDQSFDHCESTEVLARGVMSPNWDDASGLSNGISLPLLLNCRTLTIEKSSSDVSVSVGENFTYTVTVTNSDTITSAQYAFTDPLPNGIELAGGNAITTPDGATCSVERAAGTTTITCESENGPPVNGSHDYTFTVRANDDLDNDVCGTVTNTVEGTTGQWTTTSATVDVTVECTEYVMTKSVSPATAEPGDTIRYRFDLTNSGLTHADFEFTDQFDMQNLTYVRGDTNGAFCRLNETTGSMTCERALWHNRPAGEPIWLWMEFELTENPTEATCANGISNTVVLGDEFWHPDATQHTLSAHLNIDCRADIEITKSAPASVNPGDPLEYTLTVTNTGSITITDVRIVEIMPLTGVSGWSVQPPDGIACEMYGAVLACDTFSLPATANHTFTITGTTEDNPGALLCSLPYLNQALVGGLTVVGPVGDSSDWVSTRLNCNSAIEVTKTDTLDGAIEPGSTFTYEINVENTGTLPLTDVVVNDPLPSDVTFVSWLERDGMSCDDSVRCTVSGLGAGESHTIQFEVLLNTDLTADVCEDGVTNTANASGRSRTRLIRLQSSDDETTTVNCITSIEFHKQPLNDADTVIPGETIGFEITLENSGNLNLTATIEDDLTELPDGGEWTITIDDGAPFQQTGLLTHTVTDLVPESSITIRIESTVIPDDLTLPESVWCVNWENTASITGDYSNGVEIEDSRAATVHVNCTGLSIVKDVSSPVIEPGGQVEYTITVTNQGNTVVESILVTDEINLTTTAFTNWEISAEGAVGCDVVEEIGLSCIFEALEPQESVVVAITADALDLPTWEQCAPVENTAMFAYFFADTPVVTSLQTDLTPPETFIYSNTVTTQLDCQPDIEITKNGEVDTGADGRVDAGDTITYTFEVTNSGNVTLYDIAVVDDMDGLEWESDPTHTELLPEASITFTATYAVTQADIDAGEVINIGVVTAYSAPGPDDAPELTLLQEEFEVRAVAANDTAITDLEHEPGVELVKSSTANTGDDDVLNLGETIEYTFTIENTGNVTLTDLDVVDHMEGVVFEDDTTIGSLGAGETTELTANYTVTQADVDAGIIVNCADVTASAPDETEVSDLNKCATDLIDQNPSLLIVQSCTGPSDEFLPAVGDEVTYLMTISNDGNQTVHALIVTTSRDGIFDEAFPTTFAPGQSETREWTIIVTQDDYDAREVTIEVTVSGETDAGASATLASMVAMQSVEGQVQNTNTLTCPMGDLPDVSPTPTPDTPTPATPQAETPAAVTKLPETGHGGFASVTSVLWAAAMLSTTLLGIAAVGIRRYTDR